MCLTGDGQAGQTFVAFQLIRQNSFPNPAIQKQIIFEKKAWEKSARSITDVTWAVKQTK
ncbi:MAG TPA: hypothetical protein PLD20_10430 [Blastocatellia bacterium]|nr:hypothetical protein [Blastocatellia bacterium]HMZ18335.1 hypothetical protein [Blastocatellia bacterium]HNG28676.1 hypothetical protein [Blastocatellia bacterium]